MRVVPLPITEEYEQGKDSVVIHRVAAFYIAGWDRTNPYGKGFDADGDGIEDMVWGYFIPDTAVLPDFLLVLDPDNPGDNPLAPLVAVLIE